MERPFNAAVLHMLGGLLAGDRAVRTSAEEYLRQLETQEGFAPELAHVVADPRAQLPPHVRQLACIVLKNYVKAHWCSLAERFVPPQTPPADKAAVRAAATQALGAPDSKLRTAAALCVNAILRWEWPDAWPTALADLVRCLRSTDPHLLRGAVRCIDLFVGADNLLEENVPELAQLLFPELLRIFVSPHQYDAWLRAKAAGIFRSCVQWLALHDVSLGRAKLGQIFGTNLPSWIAAFAASMSQQQQQQQQSGARGAQQQQQQQQSATAEIATHTVVVETFSVLLASFPSFVRQYVTHMVPHIWACFVSTLPLYERGIIQSSSLEGEPDEDGEVASVAKLVGALLECFSIIVEKASFRGALRSRIADLVQATVVLMQMSSEQSERWLQDADAFVQEEDDESLALNIRLTGKDVLALVADSFPEGVQVCWAGIQAQINQAATLRQQDNPHWWRLREAALMAVSAIAPKFIEAAAQGTINVNISASFATLLGQDIAFIASKPGEQSSSSSSTSTSPSPAAAQQMPPYAGFLVGRALCCAADLSRGVTSADALPFVHAAAMALVQRHDLITTVGACKALMTFCPSLPPQLLAPFMPTVLTNIASLVSTAEEDTLTLLLSTLYTLVPVSPEAATIYESTITTALLSVWARKVSDPLLADDVADVLKRLARIPSCLPGVLERVLPTIALVLGDAERYPGLVTSCIDMLQVLALLVQQDATPFKAPLTALTKYLSSCPTDCESIDLGCACMRVLVFRFCALLPQWGPVARGIVEAALRLLDPAFSDSDSASAARLLEETLTRFSAQLSPFLETIAGRTLQRLAGVKEAESVMPLVCIFAHIIINNGARWAVEFLAANNALSFFMSRWISHHNDLRRQGHYRVKQSTVALAKLLLLRAKFVDEASITVVSLDTDESQPQPQPIPLPVAILQIICQEYKHSDWESTMDASTRAVDPAQTRASRSSQHGGEEKEEEEDGDDDDGSSVAADVLEKLKAEGKLFASAEDFASLLRNGGTGEEEEEEEYDEDEEDAEAESEDQDILFVQDSPLFKLDLKQHLESSVREAVAADPGLLDFLKSLYFRMAQDERAIFDILWSRVRKQ